MPLPAEESRDEGLRTALRELALERPCFGYRRLWVMLGRRGWSVNRKRVYRFYREEGLGVRRRKHKQVAAVRAPLLASTRPDEV